MTVHHSVTSTKRTDTQGASWELNRKQFTVELRLQYAAMPLDDKLKNESDAVQKYG